ncbi:10589_t:CDS:10 [Cetraspora pellucida]|uniref:10589_t:CDS:1 n=1 Tax=Cetraspora pellucida TaxID=1433469 RepID=A0A9N9CR91_9GLOM|nr:10589_t:CDS:10 [Cetraspora pellucida]
MASYLDFSDRHRDSEDSKLRVYAKTAVHSCVIHKMLVCALRGKERKDVVFSKETVLELLEITQEGDLIPIIEQPVFGTIKDFAVLHCNFSGPLLFDPINGSVQMYLGDNISELQHLRMIPGQDVLVCLSDSGVLSFIAYTECVNVHFNEGLHNVHKEKGKAVSSVNGSCVETSRKTGRFQIIKEIPLSQPGFDYRKLGRLVCIDPSGCLIAVAAWQNIFQLFSLHRGPKASFDQISQTKEYPQGRIICCMTFLYPSDKTRILLAMAVHDDLDKQTSIIIYQFSAEDAPERNITPFSKLPLRKDEPLPLHLIPLPNFPECFLLVNVRIIERETCFIQAKQVISGIADFCRESLPFPEFLVTAFAYPADAYASKQASSSQQYVYAGVENGDLYRIDINSDVQIEYTLLRKGLNSIGTAMTVLSFDLNVGDFVILSGEMSDGAVVLVCPNSKTEITCSIPNWAPILDFQMLDFYQERHDVIFTCSGRDKHGSIRELRKAVCVNIITRTGPDFHGVNALWNLKYSHGDEADSFLALSYANSTRLMKVSQGELHDISEYSGLDLEVNSLCVASFSSAPGFVIQIHRLKIVVSEPNVGIGAIVENSCITSSRWTWTSPENAVIEVAAVYDSNIVVGLSTINGSVIALLRLNFEDTRQITFTEVSQSSLDCQLCFIRCIAPSDLVPYPLCVIGTFKPSIKLLSLKPDNYLEMLREELLMDYSIMNVNIPESACIIGSVENPFFLVGLREGTIIYYQWSWSSAENKPHLTNPVVRRIGTLPVKFIVPDSSQTFIREQIDSHTVLALSDRPWQVKHSNHTGLNFVCVAFEHYEHVQDATVFRYDNLLQGYMFISQNCLNFVQLNNFTKDNIRTIPVRDTPRRLFYDDSNKLIVVACTSCKDDFPISVLKLIDPVNGDIIHEFKLQDEDYPDNLEAVYSITGWQFTIERQEYRWICVGIGVHYADERHMIGKGSGFKYELWKINQIDVNGVVHAICPLSETYILIGAGKTLNLLRHYVEEKKERLTRLISDSIMLNENLAVGADKCGNIFGLLYNKDDPSIEPCLEPVFSFHEAEIVSRLRVGYLGYRTETMNKHSETSSDHNSEVKVLDDLGWDMNYDLTHPVATIIGCSLIGSVLLFMRISIKSYRLLSVLQSILEKWPSTRPCNHNIRFRSDSNHTGSINVTIDGDMVSQFLRLSRQEQAIMRIWMINP